ncbi:hypothetical protein [Cohnella thailandensis]|uniref:Uncharacterized protein n=1 Tax=Cohnella thailandensis TaxID=557557 RepID=A0A841T7U0_9BACL|nr:hypothetical protein [Cohnella thailandensis]MBB6638130.1 hypothetical protein [Cohnella thailandensis]MBP1971943.1 hypothetical protein [Cohnella thailandensis]
MRSQTKKNRLLLGVTSVVLATAPFFSAAEAAMVTTTVPAITAVSKVVKPIYLNAKSYINLVDVSLAPADNGQTAAFRLSVYNGSTAVLDLSDYLLQLTNTAGSSYTLKTASADSLTAKIAPGSKVFITLYASVGESTKLSDLKFRVSKFDFSSAGYVKGIGSFTFPTTYTNIVGVGSYKALYYNNTTLNTKVYTASVGASGENNYVNINFVYNNTGKNAVTLSKYKYYIMTNEGIIYQATTEEEDITIDPLERKEIQLTATVPASLKTTGWKLLIVNESDAAAKLPVGSYQLSFSGAPIATSTDSFTYSNTNGKYQFKLAKLLREPMDSKDILAARIRITNQGTVSADLPNISGYFYLDDKVKLDFKTVASSNQFGLNAGGYVDVDVYATLPANYSFTKASIIVNNKTAADTTAVKIGQLGTTSAQTSLPVNTFDKAYSIAREGSQMTGTINGAKVYTGLSTKLFTVQMALASDEKRSIDPVNLTAYFISDNDEIFPATISTGTGKVNPQGKSLVTFKASVPLGYDTSKLRLIVGEGVTDTAYTTGTAIANAYVNGAIFALPAEQGVTNSYQNLTLLPYNLSINTFTPTILGDNVKLTFKYDLSKDTSYNIYPTDTKYLMTVVGTDTDDGTEYTYISQDLTIEGDGESALTVGDDKTISFEKANPYGGVDSTLRFTVRLYEVIDGAKKLVAERPMGYWFLDNDWTQEALS